MVDEWRAVAYKGLSNDGQDRSVQDMKTWLSEHESEWYDQKREYAIAQRLLLRGSPFETPREATFGARREGEYYLRLSELPRDVGLFCGSNRLD
jgi:hypothetical protein